MLSFSISSALNNRVKIYMYGNTNVVLSLLAEEMFVILIGLLRFHMTLIDISLFKDLRPSTNVQLSLQDGACWGSTEAEQDLASTSSDYRYHLLYSLHSTSE